METLHIAITQELEAIGLPLPSYATPGSAGLDLCAALPEEEPQTLAPGERALLSTGLRIALPPGYEGQIRPRSGLAVRHGIGMVNAPGTLDSDYRGVVQILLVNLGDAPYTVHRGDRIAQLIVAPVVRALPVLADTLPSTERGEGGFGSTGRGFAL